MRTVKLALRHPGVTLALAAFILVAVQIAYGKFGRGVEFFPSVEPDFGQVIVHGRGNLSLEEKDKLVAEVERRVLTFEGLATVYTRIGEQPRGMVGARAAARRRGRELKRNYSGLFHPVQDDITAPAREYLPIGDCCVAQLKRASKFTSDWCTL